MDWRWNWLWSIFWSIILHIITLSWGALSRDGDELKNWWRSFWREVLTQLDNQKGWVKGRISYLKGYAFGLVYQLGMEAARWVSSLRGWTEGAISSLRGWSEGSLNWLRGHAESLVNSARSWAQGLVNAVYAWARPYVDSAINWVRGRFEWIQTFRELIASWLPWVRGAIDWLRNYARDHLQNFLNDPVGYVLGGLLNPIRNFINWWSHWRGLLQNFTANYLPGLLNLLARGLQFLLTFVDRPRETILNLLYPVFLDWLEQLIADNW